MVDIKAEITLEDHKFYMSPYGPVPERWPLYVRNLRITDENGQTIKPSSNDSSHWIVEGLEEGQRLQLSYQIALEHEQQDWPGGIDGVAFTTPWGMMASGRALFVMNGQNKQDLSVSVQVPDDWQVSAPWPADGGTYTIPNLEQLQESLLFVGTHREVNIERAGFTLKFVMGGDGILQQEAQYTQMANQLLDYYIGMMGGLPLPKPGDELSTAMVLINESEDVDGEVIGNHISMLMNPQAGMQTQLQGWFMFAHEFFHLWNGKTLRFRNTETDWFKEGITNYYTMKALYQIGFANEQALRGILNGLFYQRYINDPGYGELSPVAAGSPLLKDSHWGLVYGGGLFAGICLDMEIRHRSENQHSLDDLMRQLYQTYGGQTKTISNEGIRTMARKLGSQDFDTLWEKSGAGTKPVPLTDYLGYAGQSVVTEDGQLQIMAKDSPNELQRDIWAGFLGTDARE